MVGAHFNFYGISHIVTVIVSHVLQILIQLHDIAFISNMLSKVSAINLVKMISNTELIRVKVKKAEHVFYK